MDVLNIIMDLYSAEGKAAKDLMQKLLVSSQYYKPEEIVNLMTSLVQTRLANSLNSKVVVQSSISNDIVELVDNIALLNLDKIKSPEVSALLITKLLTDNLQDYFLKLFLTHELPLGWVDSLLSEYPYQTRVEAIIQLSYKDYSKVSKSSDSKLTFRSISDKIGSKKKLSSLYLNKIFNEETSFISVGLILLVDYFKNLNLNYDIFCSVVENTAPEEWGNIPLWSSNLNNLKPYLSDRKILTYLASSKDDFELIDSASMLRRIEAEGLSVEIPKSSDLTEFHTLLVEKFRQILVPNRSFAQDSISSWQGDDFSENLKVHIPLSTEELKSCSEVLKICVGYAGYDIQILYGRTNIFFLKEKDVIKYCIQISKNEENVWKVMQARGFLNQPLDSQAEWDLRVYIASKNNPIVL